MYLYIDRNYPKNLASALKYLHSISGSYPFNIIYKDKRLADLETHKTVVFLFDNAKKGIDLPTRKHVEAGYRVFAFKTRTAEKLDLFVLSLQVLSLWKKILDKIETSEGPYVYTYGYRNTKLDKFVV